MPMAFTYAPMHIYKQVHEWLALYAWIKAKNMVIVTATSVGDNQSKITCASFREIMGSLTKDTIQ